MKVEEVVAQLKALNVPQDLIADIERTYRTNECAMGFACMVTNAFNQAGDQYVNIRKYFPNGKITTEMLIQEGFVTENTLFTAFSTLCRQKYLLDKLFSKNNDEHTGQGKGKGKSTKPSIPKDNEGLQDMITLLEEVKTALYSEDIHSQLTQARDD